ncbi:hypothetical protein FRC08_001516 [Ceratobasidium sp. 394]|nr:hypothetical protein FRC08_001516 [Ceratobasidium sp. 394]
MWNADMAGRAALNVSATDTYWFKGDKYTMIRWRPDTIEGQGVVFDPRPFAGPRGWSSLKQSGFTRVDAIMPLPDRAGRDPRAYFFCGSKYILVEYVPESRDELIGSVMNISDGWPFLATADFNRVDGALLVPGRTDEAYIFSGEKYCRIRLTENATNDELLDGPKLITTGWSVMNFNQIDTIIPRPESENGAYVFSGGKYVQLKVAVGGTDQLVSNQRDVAADWPALKQAGFY